MPAPESLVVKYADGTEVELPFAGLPLPLQLEIMKQPAASFPSADPAGGTYVLVEWEDGWREVTEVDPSCESVMRYYVISRTEEVGRLSLKTGGDYPQLLQLDRRPLGVRRLIFAGGLEGSFALTLRSSEREGKKTDHWFGIEPDGGDLTDIRAEVLAAAGAEGVSVSELRKAGATPELARRCRAVAARLGLVAGSRQQDLYDFLASIVGEEAQG